MRIVVFDFHSKMMIEVIRALQSRSIETVYWVAGKQDFMNNAFENKEMFPNTIFHNADDATSAIPAREIDVLSFKPLGRDFIKQFLECELRSLMMMESIDRTGVSLMKKVHMYHEYLKYWYGVLSTLKPDAIIYNDAPHKSYKYVVYCVAKHLGIRQVMLRNTQIGGRMFLTDDTEDYRTLRTLAKANEGKNFTVDDLSLDIRDYYQKQRSIDQSPFYARSENIRKRTRMMSSFLPSTETVIKNIKNLTLLKTAYLYIRMLFTKRTLPSIEPFRRSVWKIKLQEKKWKRTKDEFKNEYTKYQTKPNYSKKYIYIALQRQPERSTLTDGDVFVDQTLMIDILSHIIPSDWIIYVKESQIQWTGPRSHAGRFKGYTEEIARKDNVYVVPIETSTFDLIKNSQTVAGVTGSPPWEAILRGKPSIAFGYTWYVYCDGVFVVHDIESAKCALEKIQAGFTPDQQKIINFLKAFDESTICGYRDNRFKDGDDLNIKLVKNDSENVKSIADGLYRALINETENVKRKEINQI